MNDKTIVWVRGCKDSFNQQEILKLEEDGFNFIFDDDSDFISDGDSLETELMELLDVVKVNKETCHEVKKHKHEQPWFSKGRW